MPILKFSQKIEIRGYLFFIYFKTYMYSVKIKELSL